MTTFRNIACALAGATVLAVVGASCGAGERDSLDVSSQPRSTPASTAEQPTSEAPPEPTTAASAPETASTTSAEAPTTSAEAPTTSAEAPTTSAEAPTTEASAPPSSAAADPVAAGREVFASAGCGGCHVLADAGASGNVGPNLDELRPDATRVAAKVAAGGGGMPAFAGQLSDQQIADVAAYVATATGAGAPADVPATTGGGTTTGGGATTGDGDDHGGDDDHSGPGGGGDDGGEDDNSGRGGGDD